MIHRILGLLLVLLSTVVAQDKAAGNKKDSNVSVRLLAEQYPPELGNTPLILKSGETAKSRPNGAVDNTYYDIAFAVREESGDKIISSSR